MILHEGQPILMDTLFFFIVGRLYRQRGVDHIAWLSTMLASGLFTSLETYVPFLQNSVTLYAMHCIWPWKLWVFVIGVITLCSAIVVLHIRQLIQDNLLAMKIFEMSLCILLFMLPPMSSPYFHFHHWFAGWLVGMHCNLDTWWSRLTMAWCWGAYINGIAVYGRDPLLTCGYAFYLSWSNRCPYLQCYVDEMKNHTHGNYQIMEPQDWRNCSAADYVP